MNLEGYKDLCKDLGQLCKDARGPQAPGGWSARLGEAAQLEQRLRGAIQSRTRLASDCEALKAAPGRAGIVAGYRQEFAVYEQIKALAGDIEAGVVSCPENLRGQLVWRLNGLYSECLEVSGFCLAVFDRLWPREPGTVPEKIRKTSRAREVAERFQRAGYIGPEFLFIADGHSNEERGLVCQELGRACGHGWITRLEMYWGMEYNEASRDAYKAPKEIEARIRGIAQGGK